MRKKNVVSFLIWMVFISTGFVQSVKAEKHTVICDTFDISTVADGDIILVSGTVMLIGRCDIQKSVNILCAAGTKLTIHDLNVYPYSQSAAALCFEGGLDNRLYVSGNNTLRGDSRYAAISIAKNAALTIDGDSCSNLIAYGTDNSAGIGGGYSSTDTCGTIIIDGGNITATGGWGAGIGAGSCSFCENIIINGGNITAISGSSAGIGAGYYSGCGSVIVNGGHIFATANSFGAGIGAGNRSNSVCGLIEINGGDITAISNWGAGIGASCYSCCRRIEINGGKINTTGTSACVGMQKESDPATTCGLLIINGGIIVANSQAVNKKSNFAEKDEIVNRAMIPGSNW